MKVMVFGVLFTYPDHVASANPENVVSQLNGKWWQVLPSRKRGAENEHLGDSQGTSSKGTHD
jgi:hypothetical protein